MIRLGAKLRSENGRLVDRWTNFWFRPQPAYTLGLLRIAFGALMFFWALETGQSLYARFGVTGFYPHPPSDPFLWSIFKIYPSDSALLVGWLVLMASSVALMVGWHSRLAAILVFILVFSFERRDPWIFNAGDGLIRIMSFLVALAPSGAALSLDQRRRTGTFWSAQERNLWTLRLMQVYVSVIYLSTALAKLQGDTWQNGTAVAYTLRLDDMLILPVPWFVSDTPLIANVLTWATLLTELSIGLLVWNKRWRARVLFAGVLLHLSIMLTVVIGFFSIAMFVLYLAFVPTERAKAIADAMARRSAAFAERFRRRDRTSVEALRDDPDKPEILELPPAPSKPAPIPRDEPAPVFVVRAADQPTGRHARHAAVDSGAVPAPVPH